MKKTTNYGQMDEREKEPTTTLNQSAIKTQNTNNNKKKTTKRTRERKKLSIVNEIAQKKW